MNYKDIDFEEEDEKNPGAIEIILSTVFGIIFLMLLPVLVFGFFKWMEIVFKFFKF